MLFERVVTRTRRRSLRKDSAASTNSTFEEWRDLGFDRHSIVANPEFLNPETLGFPLSPDSPARKLGFVEIDTSRIGIRGAGASGVVLFGSRAFHPMFNDVTDNHIHHVGAINLGTNGVGRNTIEYNDIRRVCLETFDTGAINSWSQTS